MRQRTQKAFVFGTWIVAASVVVQFLLAGLGVFTYAGFFFWHAVVNSSVIFFLPLLLVLIGWLGGVPGRLLWLAAAVSGLTVLQSLLLAPYHMVGEGLLRAISSLHVPNALFIAWVTLQLVDGSRAWWALSRQMSFNNSVGVAPAGPRGARP